MFRTGGGFGFPYKISGGDVKRARKYSQKIWWNDRWPGAKHSISWLLDKFKPVPTWHTDETPKEGRNIKVVERILDAAPKPTAGIVYYTDGLLDKTSPRVAQACRAMLKKAAGDMKIVSVSLNCNIDLGDNIRFDGERGVLAMFKQILLGLENIGTDVVFFAEHDVVYNNTHFEHLPLEKGVFYYNQNQWKVDSKAGQSLFYYCKRTSMVSACTETAIDHYKNRVARVEKEGFTRRMGYEPGTHKLPRGFDYYTSDVYFSSRPIIDIRHGKNLSGKARFRKEQYRNQRGLKGWTLADEIPQWGKTKGCFDQFLKNIEKEAGII
jgi:hypothetical protein